jgi:hypothetical protein
MPSETFYRRTKIEFFSVNNKKKFLREFCDEKIKHNWKFAWGIRKRKVKCNLVETWKWFDVYLMCRKSQVKCDITDDRGQMCSERLTRKRNQNSNDPRSRSKNIKSSTEWIDLTSSSLNHVLSKFVQKKNLHEANKSEERSRSLAWSESENLFTSSKVNNPRFEWGSAVLSLQKIIHS